MLTNVSDVIETLTPVAEYSLPSSVTWTLAVLYSVVCLISVVGNITIIVFTLKDSPLKSTANCFLVCIAFGDLLFVSVCVPFTAINNLIQFHWTFGPIMCRVVGYVQAVSVIHRALTLVASAAVQHDTFRRPFRRGVSIKAFVVIMVFIWIISLLLSSPIATFSKLIEADSDVNGTYLCVEIWPDVSTSVIYGVTLMVVTYLVPLLVFVVTKRHIACLLSIKPPGEKLKMYLARRRSIKRKTLAQFVMIVSAYAICWLPIHLITIIGDVTPSIYDYTMGHVLWLFAHFIAVSNSAVNPVIVLLTQSKFREKIADRFFKRSHSITTDLNYNNFITKGRSRSNTQSTCC